MSLDEIKLKAKPLDETSHDNPELHFIGGSLLQPTFVTDVVAGQSSFVGVRPAAAREDHVHGMAGATTWDVEATEDSVTINGPVILDYLMVGDVVLMKSGSKVRRFKISSLPVMHEDHTFFNVTETLSIGDPFEASDPISIDFYLVG